MFSARLEKKNVELMKIQIQTEENLTKLLMKCFDYIR